MFIKLNANEHFMMVNKYQRVTNTMGYVQQCSQPVTKQGKVSSAANNKLLTCKCKQTTPKLRRV